MEHNSFETEHDVSMPGTALLTRLCDLKRITTVIRECESSLFLIHTAIELGEKTAVMMMDDTGERTTGNSNGNVLLLIINGGSAVFG